MKGPAMITPVVGSSSTTWMVKSIGGEVGRNARTR